MKPKVFLTGSDNTDWALDDDLRLTKLALQGLVEFSGPKDCQVVHTMWWSGLTSLPDMALRGKRIISHMPGEPFRYLGVPGYSHEVQKVGCWITYTTQAHQQLESIGIKSALIPYTVNTSIFRPLSEQDEGVITLRQKWNIPDDAYLIGNFHRDTKGSDLTNPKLEKGPDIFVEIVRTLIQRQRRVHVVLAGPRRFWIRQKLDQLQIPYTFVGNRIEGQDDMIDNNLPHTILNLLYNLVDVYIVSSRTEGGPRSILEATAARCKIISTPVGLAQDVLQSNCVYRCPVDAVDLLDLDIREGYLNHSLEEHYQKILGYHQPHCVTPLFAELYAGIQNIKPYQPKLQTRQSSADVRHVYQSYARMKLSNKISSSGLARKAWQRWGRPNLQKVRHAWKQLRYHRSNMVDTALTIGLWHQFVKPPYGGGNQFMLAIRKGLMAHSVNIVENIFTPNVDVYLLNSIHFDVKQLLQFAQNHPISAVHRIDGPIHLVRGYDKEKDDLCYELNREFASATVVQSEWTFQRICESGYFPINPIIIRNAADSDIFHAQGRVTFDQGRKIRLISTSWSNSPRKGGPIYKWIEENLDWERFEYTFVGRASESFSRIRQIEPVPSDELARILRQHDIYITASDNDPCSNALVEALSCGLPALFLNAGGHPELVGYGGLPFNDVGEILPQLEKLTANYEMFQNLIQVSRLDEVVEKYYAVLKGILHK